MIDLKLVLLNLVVELAALGLAWYWFGLKMFWICFLIMWGTNLRGGWKYANRT